MARKILNVKNRGACSVPDCASPARYKGMCGKHYKRSWRHGDPNKTLINMEGGPCRIQNCDRPSQQAGFCSMHYQRWHKYGRTELIRAPNGDGAINAGGYRILTVNGKRVYEHILLAEKALGRPLPPGAVVHHMNGIPDDNFTPLNLVICPNQAYHLLLHRRART